MRLSAMVTLQKCFEIPRYPGQPLIDDLLRETHSTEELASDLAHSLLDELKNPMFNFYNLSRIVFFFVTIVQARVETIHEVLNTLAGEFIDALIVLAQRASCRFNDTPGSLMHSSMAAIRYD